MKRPIILLFIFVLAMSLRIIAISEGTSAIESDEIEYDRLATSLLSGNGYVTAAGLPTSHRPPLYPAMLAAIYAVFGHSYFAVKIIQAVAGSATAILIYLLAENIFNKTTAILAGLLSSFYMPFLVCTRLLYTETFFIFLLFLITYLIIIMQRVSLAGCAALGLLCAALTLLRSNGFLMIFIVVFGLIIKARNANLTLNKIFLSISTLILCFVLVITPWTIRNYTVHKRFVLISTNAGLNMYQATIKTSGKIYAIDPKDPVEVKASAASNEVDRNSIYTRAAMGFYKKHPLKALKMLALRYLFFWNIIDWEVMGGEVVNYQYVFILPFAIAGALFALKTQKEVTIILLVMMSFISLVLLIPGTARYRMPIDGYLMILGCYGIYEFVSRQKTKAYPVILTVAYLFAAYLLYKYSIYTKYFIKAFMERIGFWW